MTDFFLRLKPDLVAYAVFGALVLWLKLRYGSSFFANLELMISDILTGFTGRLLIHAILFCLAGGVVTMLFVGPLTGRQAFSAGAGFTVILGDAVRNGSSSKKKAVQP